MQDLEQDERRLDRTQDGAIELLADDLLGRDDFARNLARTIARRRGRASFVIGLQGPWGCGKSSIKNMVVDAIKQMPDGHEQNVRPLIVEFAPWQFRGTDALFQMFFEQLADSLGKTKPKTAKKLRLYAGKLAFGSTLIGAAGAALTATTGVPFTLLPALVGLLKAHKEHVDQAADVAVQEENDSSDLSALKEELVKELAEFKTPILVIIDDIDRLYAQETALIFQLVKANADFPNFVYLLLYDHGIVAQSLEQVVAGKGEAYLEKIVQHPITVPIPNRNQMREVWIEELKRLYDELKLTIPADSRMWSNLQQIYESVLFFYLGNLRDVWRTINALDLSLPLMVKNGHLDVNFADFVVLEVLRVREPLLYDRLPQHKNALLGTPNSWEQAQTAARYATVNYGLESKPIAETPSSPGELDALIRSVAGEDQRHYEISELVLRGLFPHALWKRVTNSPTLDNLRSWNKYDAALGVGEADYFDRYFRLRLNNEDFLESDINALLTASDIENVRAKLAQYHLQGRLEEVIGRILIVVHQQHRRCSIEFLAALLEVGDWESYCHYQHGFFHVVVTVLRTHFRQQLDNVDERAEQLQRVFETSQAIAYPMFFITGDLAILYDAPSEKSPESDLQKHSRLIVQRIERLANEDGLHLHSCADQLMIFWRQHQPAAVQKWCESVGDDAEKMIEILDSWSRYWFDGSQAHPTRDAELLRYFSLSQIVNCIETVKTANSHPNKKKKRTFMKIFSPH